MADFTEMKVAGIALDPSTGAPIVLLKDADEQILLPIWIGLPEASSIAAALENLPSSRPMTHDLLKNILDAVDAKVLKIEIIDIRNNVFYAMVHIECSGRHYEVDARPSDAIALGLRAGSSIFVADKVIQASAKVEKSDADMNVVGFENDQDKLKKLLEEMDPEDFGKYNA